jgi:hypothetical protein
VIAGNVASIWGGGTRLSTLINCTVTGNSARYGGGVHSSAVTNSIVYFNSASERDADYDYASSFKYCCTTPLPKGGFGITTNRPLFIDTNNWSDLRLLPNSPCINSGRNPYVFNDTDLDGNPRILGGTVDMGAYEYQLPESVISYAWLQQHGLPTDGSADFIDSDADMLNNWNEWQAWTNPTNDQSALRIISIERYGEWMTIRFSSVPWVRYFLERSGIGTDPPVFEQTHTTPSFTTRETISLRDTDPPPEGALYRIRVAE